MKRRKKYSTVRSINHHIQFEVNYVRYSLFYGYMGEILCYWLSQLHIKYEAFSSVCPAQLLAENIYRAVLLFAVNELY